MDGPLKGMFEFSKRQQLGLLFFLTVILASLLVIRFHAVFMPVPAAEISPLDSAWLVSMDSMDQADVEFQYDSKDDNRTKKILPEPFPFDPNVISIPDLEKLGFSRKQAESIDRYRSKGGTFRKVEDFKKMYVVDDFMYERLLPFLQIPEKTNYADSKKPWEDNAYEKKEWDKPEKAVLSVLLLNEADSTSLEALPGIGPVYAQRIIKYRDQLGGYISLDQLKEVYGIDKNPEILDVISPYLKVNGQVLNRINVNKATWGELVKHPYINKNIANSIIAIREQHGPYKTVDEVSRSHLISAELFPKLKPYLTVGN